MNFQIFIISVKQFTLCGIQYFSRCSWEPFAPEGDVSQEYRFPQSPVQTSEANKLASTGPSILETCSYFALSFFLKVLSVNDVYMI